MSTETHHTTYTQRRGAGRQTETEIRDGQKGRDRWSTRRDTEKKTVLGGRDPVSRSNI